MRMPSMPHDRDTETVGISEKQFSLLGSYVQAVVELAVDIQHNFECDCFSTEFEKNCVKVLRRIMLRTLSFLRYRNFTRGLRLPKINWQT